MPLSWNEILRDAGRPAKVRTGVAGKWLMSRPIHQRRDALKERIRTTLDENARFIHIGGSDFLIREVVNFLKECCCADIGLSCCNNAKLCCGEGICGACTHNDSAQSVRRLCKEQVDPWYIAERCLQ